MAFFPADKIVRRELAKPGGGGTGEPLAGGRYDEHREALSKTLRVQLPRLRSIKRESLNECHTLCLGISYVTAKIGGGAKHRHAHQRLPDVGPTRRDNRYGRPVWIRVLKQGFDGRVAAGIWDDNQKPVAGRFGTRREARQQPDETDPDHDRRPGKNGSQDA